MNDDMLSIALDSTTRILADRVTPAVREGALAGVWPEALWAELTEAGLHLALVAEDAGGFGLAAVDALAIIRRAAEYAVPVPMGETMLCNALLARFGIAPNDGAVALPAASDAPLVTINDAGAGTWHVRGSAAQICWPRNLSSILALASQQASDDLALVRVPCSAWTVATEGKAITGLPQGDVVIDGEVDAADVAPVGTFGPDDLRSAAAALRVVELAGTMAKVLDMTVAYMNERNQFGRPLSKFQVVQHELAKVGAATAATQACADMVAEAFPDKLDVPLVAAAKSRAGEAAGLVAGIAHQLHGAIGFTEEFVLHHLTRQMFQWRDDFGTETYWNKRLAKAALAGSADGLWPFITRVGI